MNRPESYHHAEIEAFSEKQDTQKFWRKLIFDVFGIINQDDYIEFEKRVLVGRTKFIDAYIPSTGIVIEQKSQGADLTLPERQSDGSMLTPYEQAKRYYDWLPVSQKGGYILTCNFDEISSPRHGSTLSTARNHFTRKRFTQQSRIPSHARRDFTPRCTNLRSGRAEREKTL